MFCWAKDSIRLRIVWGIGTSTNTERNSAGTRGPLVLAFQPGSISIQHRFTCLLIHLKFKSSLRPLVMLGMQDDTKLDGHKNSLAATNDAPGVVPYSPKKAHKN